MGGTLPPFSHVFIVCIGTTLTLHRTSRDLIDKIRVTVNERPEDVKSHKLEVRICNKRLLTSITTVNLLVFAAIVELAGKIVTKHSHVPFFDCKLRWPADDSEVSTSSFILSYKGFITAVSA